MTENNETPQINDIFKYDFEDMIKEKRTKEKYKKAALIVGIPYLITFVISSAWSQIYLFATSSLGISISDAVNFVNRSGINELIQIFMSILLFTVPFILSVIISGKTVSETVSLEKPKSGIISPLLLFGLSFCMFSNVAVSYAGGIFEKYGIDYNVDFGSEPRGIFGFLLGLISVCIIPALVEEFAFRGVVMGILLPFGDKFAIFTTAILFGIMHGNFEQMPFAFLVGIILCFIRVKTGTLWVCVLLHFINNLISLVVTYLGFYLSSEILNIYYTVFIMIALLILVPAIFLFERKDLSFSVNNNTEITEKEKYKYFFVSPIIIIAIGLYLFRAFEYFIK